MFYEIWYHFDLTNWFIDCIGSNEHIFGHFKDILTELNINANAGPKTVKPVLGHNEDVHVLVPLV